MAILGKLLGDGLEGAGENMLKKALKKASEESGEGILSKLGKKIPVSYTENAAQDIAVKAPEMQKLYRGIKAETPEKLEKYISDMLDPTIKPRTYEGAAYGEGYYFTPFRDSAESYASNDLAKPYQAVLEIEQPRNRFIGINKQNQNRPVDFAIRAEKRVGGGRAASVGERDFDNYLKKNGILGDRVNDNITVIKDNDAVKNMKVIGRREPGGVWDYNDALNSTNIQNDLDNASKFLQPKEPLTLYHGSPTKGIKDLDINMAGKDKRVSGYAKISNDVKRGEPQILEEISPSDVLKRVQDKFGKNDDFGKSVVVDKKGKLLDLYHGTDASFDKFGDIKTEPGYWFTEDKNYAQSHGKNLMTVNLNMQNPIDMTTADGENLLYDLARERFGLKDFVPEDKIFSKEFREFLQSKGYDGLIWDKDGKNTYVAFRPDQIKMRNK